MLDLPTTRRLRCHLIMDEADLGKSRRVARKTFAAVRTRQVIAGGAASQRPVPRSAVASRAQLAHRTRARSVGGCDGGAWRAGVRWWFDAKPEECCMLRLSAVVLVSLAATVSCKS